MSMLQEFKSFAMKGNVVDLAVGIVIGVAFGKIVSSFVGDVIMPVIGLLMGGVDFSGLAVTIGEASVKYGKFIQSCVDFVIIAAVIFLVVKGINHMKRAEEKPATPAAPPAPSRQEVLLEQIRDLLKKA
ncbi:MAG: large-conductance mechanosensitive channel protein MscL [Betaproteobacteria bacterium]|nr:large-conductance mechanosensitive channel protein MscL [Betaproteobacteria bacterium]